MDRWVGKVAVVTGASAGIGAVIAKDLVKAGVLVVGLGRRLERLEELSSSLDGAGGKFFARQCDLSKEEDLLNAFKWVNAELGGVDILVNNAGVFKSGRLIDDDTDSFRNMLDVNVLATSIAIREAVASMKSRDVAGHIINLNSILGHYLAPPTMPVSLYPASKFAVTALTETVRKELAAEGNNKIKITSVSPGPVKTDLIHQLPDDILQTMTILDPDDISNAILYVLATRDKVQVTELSICPMGYCS